MRSVQYLWALMRADLKESSLNSCLTRLILAGTIGTTTSFSLSLVVFTVLFQVLIRGKQNLRSGGKTYLSTVIA